MWHAGAILALMRKKPGAEERLAKVSPAARLHEAERLFQDFKELTPFRFRPFAKSFASFSEYERWRLAQTNPWYR